MSDKCGVSDIFKFSALTQDTEARPGIVFIGSRIEGLAIETPARVVDLADHTHPKSVTNTPEIGLRNTRTPRIVASGSLVQQDCSQRVLPEDFSHCLVDDLATMISNSLFTLMKINDEKQSHGASLTRFHSR